MAKKKAITKNVEVKPQQLPAQVIINKAVMVRMDLFDKTFDAVKQRIDRIVAAIDKSKSVRNL